jgi:hypothetical protein
MQIEQLYLFSTIVLAGQQPDIVRLNDQNHVKSMEFKDGEQFVRLIDKTNKLHLIPLVMVKQMVPVVQHEQPSAKNEKK